MCGVAAAADRDRDAAIYYSAIANPQPLHTARQSPLLPTATDYGPRNDTFVDRDPQPTEALGGTARSHHHPPRSKGQRPQLVAGTETPCKQPTASHWLAVRLET